MTNVIGIGKKPPESCPYCGAEKACPDFTCPRIRSVWTSDKTGEWQLEFHENWPKPPPTGDWTEGE